METIEGYVDHIIFRNEENGYTVLNLVSGNEETTCVGNFAMISEGELIEVKGTWISHSTYGEQFKAESYELKVPEDAAAMERYLGSGAIKGIGSALAARIVRRFRGDTFRIIEEEPERLAEIKGISERKAREIAEQVFEKKDMRRAMLFLQKYGITMALALKIYQYYGARIYQVMQDNPYQLADDIQGVGFKIADEIAREAGVALDSPYRIQCGIYYILQQAMADGHVYLPADVLMSRAAELLETELKHCILAHHGEFEFGSPKKPAIIEAMALNLADNLDAKLETMTEILENGQSLSEDWLGFNRFFDSNLRRT